MPFPNVPGVPLYTSTEPCPISLIPRILSFFAESVIASNSSVLFFAGRASHQTVKHFLFLFIRPFHFSRAVGDPISTLLRANDFVN